MIKASDIPAKGEMKYVRKRDLEGFYVSRRDDGMYQVRNPTAFFAGYKLGSSIKEVNQIITNAP